MSSIFITMFRSEPKHLVRSSSVDILPKGCTDLYEDGDHSDAMRALSCLSVVGIQILVIVYQLDLNEKHNLISVQVNLD